MTKLISTYNTGETNFNCYGGTEEHLLTANECLFEQNPRDADPDCWEPPVVFNDEAETAYKVWQESLSYLVENVDSF